MNQTLELCRQVYNDALALRKEALEKDNKSISIYETNGILVTWNAQKFYLIYQNMCIALLP